MRITIDNLDGLGAVDYTGVVADQGPITVKRRLNAPATCAAELILAGSGPHTPTRRGRVVVRAEDGSVFFTGYLAIEPVRVYAGESTSGSVYRVHVDAVGDEWLLDRQGSGTVPGADSAGLQQDAGELLTQLSTRVQNGSQALAVQAESGLRLSGVVPAESTAPWSVNAGLAASAGYAGYRVLGGDISVQPAGVTVHTLGDGDGSFHPSAFEVSHARELANDVTLSGAEEPAAYVTESFSGDGVTAQFTLSEPVFRGTGGALLRDPFEDATFHPARWVLRDPGGYLSVGDLGLTANGGTGSDGQTALTALGGVEMGGTLVAELGGVVLGPGSDGVLAGFYSGSPVLANCLAGFRVRQSVSSTGGETVLAAVVNGAEVGSPFTAEGHSYTLRLRLHCAEMYRVAQLYYCMVDGAVKGFGSDASSSAGMEMVFELTDEGVASNTPATVLYDTAVSGAVAGSAPAVCQFAVTSAVQMFGSVRSVRLDCTGSAWVVSTLADGSRVTRLTGVAGEGVDCQIDYGSAVGTPGSLLFLPKRLPEAGERVTVFYRGQRRAVARLADAASVAGETVGTSAGTSRWSGKVLQPPARTSADCESAAQAVLAMATSRSAAMAGRYATVNPVTDVWPGDVLEVTREGVSSTLLVRSVEVVDGHAIPEVRRYDIGFANDWATEWADGLGLRLSDKIAVDALLPQAAASGPAEVQENLPQLSVTALSGTVLQVNTGTDAPAGGGFEVRRRDWVFGPGASGADFVLRSPVRSFAIPRAAESERFYVRMFDGSTPPVYSRFSSALFVHAPVG